MDDAAAALEKAKAQLLLHLRDLRRQCRLGHSDQFGGTAEMQRFGESLEILHLPEREPDHRKNLSM